MSILMHFLFVLQLDLILLKDYINKKNFNFDLGIRLIPNNLIY
jgi:hypothetical protein